MSLPKYLFGRSWAVNVGISGQVGKRYTNLRVMFDINKTSASSCDKSKIEVYNLSGESRQLYLQAKPADLRSKYLIQLEAGYESIIKNIYAGDIRCVKNRRQATDIITTFECGDSEKNLLLAFFDKNYPPGTKTYQILQDLAAALSVDIGSVTGLPNATYNQAFTSDGSVRDCMNKLCRKNNLHWSVNSGSLQIYPSNAHNGSQAIVLSNQIIPSKNVGLTGLIDVPSQNQGITQFKALLNPDIKPGCAVQLYSENIKGDFFRVDRARYVGDSHGDKWQVECEATPIKAIQVLPQAKGKDFSKAVI